MRISDLAGKNVVIWGTGREAKAAAELIRRAHPALSLTFLDENEKENNAAALMTKNDRAVTGTENIASALAAADIVVKSPGVSLYHPLVQKARDKGTPVTSLLNLWFGGIGKAKTVCVTGTKGKSTTSTLIAHMLKALGKKAVLLGNIGVAVGAPVGNDIEFLVIEVSSYQAADFTGQCDLAVLTSLYPEHVNWHGSVETYYRDKLNLLARARVRVVNAEAAETARRLNLPLGEMVLANVPTGIHAEDGKMQDANRPLGELRNDYLLRPHNLANVGTALTAIRQLGLDAALALRSCENFKGLPHRQQELGEKDGRLYVDDSISTNPGAALAALRVYGGRPVTLIAGGYDRGVDYAPLADYVRDHKINAVICMGPSGEKISALLSQAKGIKLFSAAGMKDAVALARQNTPAGGVILLSPAAPSFGLFRDFVERGKAFATESGFSVETCYPLAEAS